VAEVANVAGRQDVTTEEGRGGEEHVCLRDGPSSVGAGRAELAGEPRDAFVVALAERRTSAHRE